MTLEEVSAALYAGSPSEFIKERDAQATAARQSGDDELATSIKRLRRPTTSAALVNALVAERGAEIDELLSISARLSHAQTRGSGDDIRALMRSRSQQMTSLGRDAERLGADRGIRVTSTIQREIQATLNAASADKSAAAVVKAGCLTAPLSSTGLGDEQRPASPPANHAGSERQRVADVVQIAEKRREVLNRRAAEAAQDAAERAADLEAAQDHLASLDKRLAELEDHARALREERTEASRRVAATRRAHDVAKRQAKRAADNATANPGAE